MSIRISVNGVEIVCESPAQAAAIAAAAAAGGKRKGVVSADARKKQSEGQKASWYSKEVNDIMKKHPEMSRDEARKLNARRKELAKAKALLGVEKRQQKKRGD